MVIDWWFLAIIILGTFLFTAVVTFVVVSKYFGILRMFKHTNMLSHFSNVMLQMKRTQEYLDSVPIKDERTKRLFVQNNRVLAKLKNDLNFEEVNLDNGNQLQ